VVARLQEVNALLADPIHKPVLLRDSSRPGAGQKVFQRLRFAYAAKRIPEDGIHKIEDSQTGLSIGSDPVPKIV